MKKYIFLLKQRALARLGSKVYTFDDSSMVYLMRTAIRGLSLGLSSRAIHFFACGSEKNCG